MMTGCLWPAIFLYCRQSAASIQRRIKEEFNHGTAEH